ncbi:uncharacterized protein PV09_09450 [Verruconis gallopava]|uniref:Uncharacterized protein n=1 Tax=Verruconis gallopava TaxID=253628 RepID=A0A0D2AIP1_9PEZI|nr:uncharacterized protein PV09_09450 [Verruconis gallopava]KIV98798.1 hypothetical protein PV09_09450 [Verruconis gallopava]
MREARDDGSMMNIIFDLSIQTLFAGAVFQADEIWQYAQIPALWTYVAQNGDASQTGSKRTGGEEELRATRDVLATVEASIDCYNPLIESLYLLHWGGYFWGDARNWIVSWNGRTRQFLVSIIIELS